jgi:hypothetical protein
VAFLAACGTPPAHRPGGQSAAVADEHGEGSGGEERFVPSYGKPELEQALATERAALDKAEATLAQLAETGTDDQLIVATADAGVRRRSIAQLSACLHSGRWCPPRLDEPAWAFDVDAGGAPPIDAALRFDVVGWRAIASELHGRACACRTLACIDSMIVAIDVLEARCTPDVDGDEAAAQSVTWARECLFRLRGRTVRAVR